VVGDDATSPGAGETWWDISTGTQCRGGMGGGRCGSVGQRRKLLLLGLRCFVTTAVLDDCWVGTNSRLTWTAPDKKRIVASSRDRSPPGFCIAWSPPATDRRRDSSGSRSAGAGSRAASASASAKTDIATRRRTEGTVMVEGHSCSSLEHPPFFSVLRAKAIEQQLNRVESAKVRLCRSFSDLLAFADPWSGLCSRGDAIWVGLDASHLFFFLFFFSFPSFSLPFFLFFLFFLTSFPCASAMYVCGHGCKVRRSYFTLYEGSARGQVFAIYPVCGLDGYFFVRFRGRESFSAPNPSPGLLVAVAVAGCLTVSATACVCVCIFCKHKQTAAGADRKTASHRQAGGASDRRGGALGCTQMYGGHGMCCSQRLSVVWYVCMCGAWLYGSM